MNDAGKNPNACVPANPDAVSTLISQSLKALVKTGEFVTVIAEKISGPADAVGQGDALATPGIMGDAHSVLEQLCRLNDQLETIACKL